MDETKEDLLDSSLCPERCAIAPTHQNVPKSIYTSENFYVQISITNIVSYVQKLSSQ